MIVVTAASGRLGRIVVEELLGHVEPSEVVATARSTEKLADLDARGVQVRELDYDRPASIAEALDGARQVLLVSSDAIGRRVDQHRAVIDGAVAAGVEHLAYTSLLRAGTSPLIAAVEHRATEELLDQADLTTTRLRNGWYLENYTENLGPVLANGAVLGSAGGGRVAAASRADLAAAAAAVLADEARWGGTYELGGEPFTMAALAAAVSEQTGRTVPYVDVPAEEYRSVLLGSGLPEPMADFLVDADVGIAGGELDADPAVLRDLIGRPLTPLVDAVKAGLA